MAQNIPNECLDLDTILLTACKDGDIDLVEFCIKNGANINCIQGESLSSPLLVAASNGHMNIIERLIDNGVDLLSLENIKAKEKLLRIKKLISLKYNELSIKSEIVEFTCYTNELKNKLNSLNSKRLMAYREKYKISNLEDDEEEYFDDDLFDIEEDDFDDDSIDIDYYLDEENPDLIEKIFNEKIYKFKDSTENFFLTRQIPFVVNIAIENKNIPMLLFLCEKIVNKYNKLYFKNQTKITKEDIEIRALTIAIEYSMYVHEYDLASEIITSHLSQQTTYISLAYEVVLSLKSSKNIQEDHLKVIEILKLLKQTGQRMDHPSRTNSRETVFHLAARIGEKEFVNISLLLLNFPEINWSLTDINGRTPEPSSLLLEELRKEKSNCQN